MRARTDDGDQDLLGPRGDDADSIARPGLARLDRMHEELDEHFLAHQEQLLYGKYSSARLLLDGYIQRFDVHTRQEEETLLPLYIARCSPPPYSTRPIGEIYFLEHRKLKHLLQAIREEITVLLRSNIISPQRIILLLERETRFKGVVEHHSERERTQLFPELSKALSPEECQRIVDICLHQWDSLKRP